MRVLRIIAGLLAVAGATPALAQDYPNRPIKAITTTSAGDAVR